MPTPLWPLRARPVKCRRTGTQTAAPRSAKRAKYPEAPSLLISLRMSCRQAPSRQAKCPGSAQHFPRAGRPDWLGVAYNRRSSAAGARSARVHNEADAHAQLPRRRATVRSNCLLAVTPPPFPTAAEQRLRWIGQRQPRHFCLRKVTKRLRLGIKGRARFSGGRATKKNYGVLHSVPVWINVSKIPASEYAENFSGDDYQPGFLEYLAPNGLLGTLTGFDRTSR